MRACRHVQHAQKHALMDSISAVVGDYQTAGETVSEGLYLIGAEGGTPDVQLAKASQGQHRPVFLFSSVL